MILLVDGINYAEGTLMNYRLQQIQKCKLSLNKYRHGKNITKNKIRPFYNSRTINFHFSYLPHW
jgi:hypothetical protein